METAMGNDERRLIGLILVIVLLASGQACRSSAMDREQGLEPSDPGAQVLDPEPDLVRFTGYAD